MWSLQKHGTQILKIVPHLPQPRLKKIESLKVPQSPKICHSTRKYWNKALAKVDKEVKGKADKKSAQAENLKHILKHFKAYNISEYFFRFEKTQRKSNGKF